MLYMCSYFFFLVLINIVLYFSDSQQELIHFPWENDDLAALQSPKNRPGFVLFCNLVCGCCIYRLDRHSPDFELIFSSRNYLQQVETFSILTVKMLMKLLHLWLQCKNPMPLLVHYSLEVLWQIFHFDLHASCHHSCRWDWAISV